MSVKYGLNFLEAYVGSIIKDPKIALIEIIANSYDAGALNVYIKWPDEKGSVYEVDDDGLGLTNKQFSDRWETLSYDRIATQGKRVAFPKDLKDPPQRTPFGKNGKGRNAPFCFDDKYCVTSKVESEEFSYIVSRSSIEKKLFNLDKNKDFSIKESKVHGLNISGLLNENYISIDLVETLIKSKFLFDPSFNIYLNNKKIDLLNLDSLESHSIKIEGAGEVLIYLLDSTDNENKSRFKGIAWWVNNRLVGNPDWKNILTGKSYLDKRVSLAKKVSFIVKADMLENSLSADWEEIHSTEISEKVVSEVENFINNKIDEMLLESRGEDKEKVVRDNIKTISTLSSVEQENVGTFIDSVQQRCKRINVEDLSNIVDVFSKLESSKHGYMIFEEMAKLAPNELDSWTEIIQKWDVTVARTVLNEIDHRLKAICEIERICDNPDTKELLELHPLIEKTLWILGPEYEGIAYFSNKSLRKILFERYGVQTAKNDKGSKRRPDFFISVMDTDSYDSEGECNGTQKIVILELKRGGSEISIEDLRQGQDYAYLLKDRHPELQNTKIVVWAIGSKVHPNAQEQNDNANHVYCSSTNYRTLVKRANARLFNLKKKIERETGYSLAGDDVINNLINAGIQENLF